MSALAFYILGYITGVFGMYLLFSMGKCDGKLTISQNPEKDIYTFHVDNLDKLETKSRIILDVVKEKEND